MVVDVDGLKAVNEVAGHATGDALLVATAERIAGAAQAGALVARIGGDEFAALVPGGAGAAEALGAGLARALDGREQVEDVVLATSVGAAGGAGEGTRRGDPRGRRRRLWRSQARR